jgi:hypothetical protein
LFRVCRVGVFHGSIATDMTYGGAEADEGSEEIRAPYTLKEWSVIYLRNRFRLATTSAKVLAQAWQIETDANANANEGGQPWYPDAATMRYCFYSKPNAPSAPVRKNGRRL